MSLIKLLGIWLDEDMSWDTNTRHICKKAFQRIQMLGKLKYAGIHMLDLITIYKLFIRSVTEYCSVVYHSSLTKQQSRKIELIQKASLKIILGNEYTDYKSTMMKFSICSLNERRDERVKKFALKCVSDKYNHEMFPLNKNQNNKERFSVNFARTSKYLNSAIPQCQRILNSYAQQHPEYFSNK